MPASKLPSARPASKNASSRSTSAAAIGRRYARRASAARIVRAHGVSSAPAAGRQVKMRARLGVSPGVPA